MYSVDDGDGSRKAAVNAFRSDLTALTLALAMNDQEDRDFISLLVESLALRYEEAVATQKPA